MHDKRKGFTLVEVLVAVVIFAFGILSMAAFASLNYMYLRVNQGKARLHVLNESMVDDLQNWMREPAIADGPTLFDSFFTAWMIAPPPAGAETIRTFISPGSLTVAVVTFDSMRGATPHASDAKIYVSVDSWTIVGNRTLFEDMDFALANYGMGE
jgi:prepilin-type N-terminal cleavage/methylation domain-containing protein